MLQINEILEWSLSSNEEIKDMYKRLHHIKKPSCNCCCKKKGDEKSSDKTQM